MLDEPTLRRLYLLEERSIRDIATLLGLPTRTVYDALMRYRIPRRQASHRQPRPQLAERQLDEISLRRWYIDEERSIRAIAELSQLSTRAVYEALIRYGIPRRTGAPRLSEAPEVVQASGVDQMALRRLYLEEGRSIAAIAAALACSPSRIRSALVRWGIERRPRGRPSGAGGE